MVKEVSPKVDILGQPLDVGCYVAGARSNDLLVCKIVKITNKMIHLEEHKTNSNYKQTFMAYPGNVVRLDGPDALAYILRG